MVVPAKLRKTKGKRADRQNLMSNTWILFTPTKLPNTTQNKEGIVKDRRNIVAHKWQNKLRF